MEAFIANCKAPMGATGPTGLPAMQTTLVTSSGSSQFTRVDGPDVLIAVRTNAIYWRWCKATDTVSAATAATQGSWLPSGTIVRLGKPVEADGIAILQDTAAAQVFITTGRGI